jgi:tetratricopeptide (TPR) repeat protein
VKKLNLCSFFLLFFLVVCPLFGVDFSVHLTPQLSIPIGNDSGLYSLGGGVYAAADATFFDFLSPSLEAGMLIQPLRNVGKSLILTRGGAGLNFTFYPISRLRIHGGGSFGTYIGSHPDTDSFSGLYWSGQADLGFRFSPAFTLSAGASFSQFLYNPEPVYSGLSVGISATLQLSSLGGKSGGIEIRDNTDLPVFPIFYTTYKNRPFGTIEVVNLEQAEIRNVKVYLQGDEYTAGRQLCGEIPMLRKGESATVPLYAIFTEELLAFSENTKIEAEIVVTYTLLNAERESTRTKTVSVYHRNAAVWKDDRVAAVFISPNDPAVLEYSKFVAGLIRDRVRPDISENLQYSMGLFEGLRLAGITYTPDPSTPYIETRTDPEAVDYIQYPHQTIAYKSGDCDDLGLLYAAVLESVGVHAAYIPLPEDFLVAVDLNMSKEIAERLFQFSNDLIYIGDKAWVPIQISRIREGFIRAWLEGIKLWNGAAEGGSRPEFIPVVDAWREFPSVGVTGDTADFSRPPDTQVENAFENSIYRFIKREIEPKISEIEEEMGVSGSGRDYNKLGIIYARYGLYEEARPHFEMAVEKNYPPAYVNLGNVAFLLGDYEKAVEYFNAALSYRQDSKSALIGLARAKYELNVFAEADELYRQIKKIDPNLAERYSYLSSQMEGSVSRASSAADRKGNVFWNEEE